MYNTAITVVINGLNLKLNNMENVRIRTMAKIMDILGKSEYHIIHKKDYDFFIDNASVHFNIDTDMRLVIKNKINGNG